MSVPLGISTPDQPNISSTLWRVVADHKNKRYYYESTRHPNVFWVNFSDMDFTAGEPTKKLTLTDNTVFAGNVAEKFETTKPFSFVPQVERDS